MRNGFKLIFAFTLCLSLASCKDAATKLAELGVEARENGEEWTVEEWKEVFRETFEIMIPYYREKEIYINKVKEAKTDEEKEKIMEEWKNLENTKYEKLNAATWIMDDAIVYSKNGKTVFRDEKFREEVFKELGIKDEHFPGEPEPAPPIDD